MYTEAPHSWLFLLCVVIPVFALFAALCWRIALLDGRETKSVRQKQTRQYNRGRYAPDADPIVLEMMIEDMDHHSHHDF